MNAQLIISLHLLLSVSRISAQATFNIVQHHPDTLSYNGANAVFEQNDGYIVFSYGWTMDTPYVGGIQLTKYDLNGLFQWQKEHRRQRHVNTGFIDPIAAISDGIFVGAMTEYGGSEPNSTFLYWWDSEGDTICTRFLKSDSGLVDANHGTRQLIPLSDGGFLHCGWCAVPQNTGCITRIDSAGAILWEQSYPGVLFIFNAIETTDGGFVLGGNRNSTQDKAVIIRTDNMGNPQWTKYHGLYSNTIGNQALIDVSGDILMAGDWKSDPLWSVYDRWSALYKYSATGMFLERKDYFFSYNAFASFILPRSLNRYWLIGGTYQYFVDPDHVMTLFELDENLDSLWMKRYWYYTPDDAESGVFCARSTSDGGLVMCGATRQGVTDPLPYLTSNWLIKLDEHGCLVPGCHTVGINEHVLGLNEYFKLWPNPVQAGAPIHFSFTPPEGFKPRGDLRVVLLDALGREVLSQIFASTQEQCLLHKTDLPSGIYHLHLTDQRSWLAGAKVVFE